MTTEFLKLKNPPEEADLDGIRDAAARLRRGALVVFPTETVYGLGANACDPAAAEKIYAAKGRPADNPLIIHISSPEEAEDYAVTSPLYYRLAEAFMPGPLTVILPVRASIPAAVTAGLPTVAVRCPAHPIANALIRFAGIPIAAPSANLSGSPSPTSAAHVREDMEGRVDVILDGGDSDIGLESTIVCPNEDGSLTLLRPGAITVEDLLRITPHVEVSKAVLGALLPGQTVLSPGMKYKHYAPKTPFFLLEGGPERAKAYLAAQKERFAILTHSEDEPILCGLENAVLIPIGSRDEPAVLAHRLFSLLRECDKMGLSAIYAMAPAPDGLGMALYNRMIRAAAHRIITL